MECPNGRHLCDSGQWVAYVDHGEQPWSECSNSAHKGKRMFVKNKAGQWHQKYRHHADDGSDCKCGTAHEET